MISSQILQNSIDEMKRISHMDLCVTDTEGKVVATTASFQTNYTQAVEEFVKSPADSQEIQGCQFFLQRRRGKHRSPEFPSLPRTDPGDPGNDRIREKYDHQTADAFL